MCTLCTSVVTAFGLRDSEPSMYILWVTAVHTAYFHRQNEQFSVCSTQRPPFIYPQNHHNEGKISLTEESDTADLTLQILDPQSAVLTNIEVLAYLNANPPHRVPPRPPHFRGQWVPSPDLRDHNTVVKEVRHTLGSTRVCTCRT